VHLRVIAVGTRMPDWVDAAFADYSRRLSGSWRIELKELAPASRRDAGGAGDAARAHEARRILALLSAQDYVVPLDEQGEQFSTLELAHWLETQRAAAQHLAFVIGGPDGLAREVLARGRKLWSLSRLTLPHALVRVVLAEQLYRAAMVLAGHPYHRAGRA
jgi:23S rRNA (pseudouridine1915-N3)-methyltransferase